ncbi:MAG: ACT domain-containing protein, partial [Bdellovibrionota bacterium]
NPAHPGTKIHRDAAQSRFPIKGFTTIDAIALINLEGTGMLGVPGVASRLFSALQEVGVSVVLISQASSEHSICAAVPEGQAETAQLAVEKAFYGEIHRGAVQAIEVIRGCSILAAVGDQMVQQPGIAGKFFGSLGRAGINIRAIAQGSSERNISAVIDRKDQTRALRAAHSAFTLSDQTLSIGLIGPGLIGTAFLDQLGKQGGELRTSQKLDLRVRGILNSKAALTTEPRILLEKWKDSWTEAQSAGKASELDFEKFLSTVKPDHLPHAVLIDCTASETIARRIPEFLARGFHVITPNKKANSGTQAQYEAIRSAAKAAGRHFLYSTNVGAGLPIIQTLRDLLRTGDRIIEIQGVFSGTLSFLFNSLSANSDAESFSTIVERARKLGYTEPDPRDDLSGLDVARKLIILARETGMKIELNDIQVESLVPASLARVERDEFLRRLSELDQPMKVKVDGAAQDGEVWRFVGRFSPSSPNSAQVGLQKYPRHHPFAALQGTDNIVAFRTERYNTQPIFVQGPGAGPEVTAAGVFADLLRLASYLGDG